MNKSEAQDVTSELLSLPGSVAADLFIRDKPIASDETNRRFGSALVDKLFFSVGFRWLGELSHTSLSKLSTEFELSNRELATISDFVEGYDLQFGEYCGPWILYRQNVRRTFQFPWCLTLAPTGQLALLTHRIADELEAREITDHSGPLRLRIPKSLLDDDVTLQ